ncbi:MAG: hypothetical protein LAP87_17375 [Acidobacteriia bacterium]|nr:hypothetical protein [Terriglobia bacterium]
MAILGFLLPVAIGIFTTGAITGSRRLVFAMAGCGIGFGICSGTYFLSLLWGLPVVALDLAALAAAGLAWQRFGNRKRLTRAAAGGNRRMAILFAVVASAAAAAFWVLSLSRPHGHWDAWCIHNLHARFLFRGGAHWRDGFTSLLEWSHPDYPPLIPASVARLWSYAGRETQFAAEALGFVFTFGTVGIVAAGVAMVRDRRRGMLAGLFLLSTPLLINFGSWECADVPLAFFFLCALLFSVADEPVMAGISASLGAWTKNEGILLLLAVVAAAMIALAVERAWSRLRELLLMAAGAAPVLMLVFWFKRNLAPPNDLMSGQSGHTLEWLMDPSRYLQAAAGFIEHGLLFGGLAIPVVVALVLCLLLDRAQVPARDRTWKPALAVTLALAGDYLVYVTSYRPIPWLISNSLDRILMQIWPAAVFTAFLLPVGRLEPGHRWTSTGNAGDR